MARTLRILLAAVLLVLATAAPALAASDPWPDISQVGRSSQPQGEGLLVSSNDPPPSYGHPRYFKVSSSPEVDPDGSLADEYVVEVFPWVTSPYYWVDATGRSTGLWYWIPGTWYWQAVGGTDEKPIVGPVREMRVRHDVKMQDTAAKRYEQKLVRLTGKPDKFKVTEDGEHFGGGSSKYRTQVAWLAGPYVYKGKIISEYRLVGDQRHWRSRFIGGRSLVSCLAKKARVTKCSKPVQGLKAGGPALVAVPKNVKARPMRYNAPPHDPADVEAARQHAELFGYVPGMFGHG